MDPIAFCLIPVVAACFWPVVMLLGRNRMLRAQWIFAVLQLLLGATILMFVAYFGKLVVHSYVADALYSLLAVFVIPLFYIFVCSLTSPSGVTLHHRWVFIPSILYAIVFAVIIMTLGNERYELYMERLLVYRNFDLRPSLAYSAMVIVGFYGFRVFLTLQVLLLVPVSIRKLVLYHKRLSALGLARKNYRVVSLFGIVLMALLLFLIVFPPKVGQSLTPQTVAVVVLSSVIILLLGHYVRGLSYSASQLESFQQPTAAPTSNTDSL